MRLRAAVVALAGVLACAGPGPVVEHSNFERDLVAGSLLRVAVAPFRAAPGFEGSDDPAAPSGAEAAALVSRFVSEAFEERGFPVVAPSDLLMAFAAQGLDLPRDDPQKLAALAAREFGATSVLLGTVRRYRERVGAAAGAMRPASVRFELDLYRAPTGERVWTARFDETQVALGEDVLRARRYPGGGTRWLSAADLCRWGARHAVAALPEIHP